MSERLKEHPGYLIFALFIVCVSGCEVAVKAYDAKASYQEGRADAQAQTIKGMETIIQAINTNQTKAIANAYEEGRKDGLGGWLPKAKETK